MISFSQSPYFIADLHIDHKNILVYENRPFRDLDHMKEILIDNWNSTVKKKDYIWVLGDFCFGNQALVKSVVSRLNGRIFLIQGNHDGSHSYDWWRECGIEFYSKYPVIYDDKYILSHEPVDEKLIGNFYNIHGHTHSKHHPHRRYINVSVEAVNYRPINFRNIRLEV